MTFGNFEFVEKAGHLFGLFFYASFVIAFVLFLIALILVLFDYWDIVTFARKDYETSDKNQTTKKERNDLMPRKLNKRYIIEIYVVWFGYIFLIIDMCCFFVVKSRVFGIVGIAVLMSAILLLFLTMTAKAIIGVWEWLRSNVNCGSVAVFIFAVVCIFARFFCNHPGSINNHEQDTKHEVRNHCRCCICTCCQQVDNSNKKR